MSTGRLFASYFGDMADACPILFRNRLALDNLELYINEWVTEQNVNEYQVSPLHGLVRSTHLTRGCYRGDYSNWKRLIRRLVRLGANIHATVYYGKTILESLMSEISHPFDSKYWGDIFLEALSEVGVDVFEYLKREVGFYNRMHFLFAPWGMQRLCIISLEEPLGVSWDWWIDPEGPAFDVLEEFKYIGSLRPRWRYSEDWDRWSASYWPYCLPYWDVCMKRVKGGIASREEHRISRIFSERFARRQNAKAAKLAKAQGLYFKGPRMPGAWVD